MSKTKLLTQIEEINSLLRAFGPQAVQKIKMVKNDKVIGQIRYGYKPQYVFDAVNYVIQPENWRYEIVSKEVFEYQAVAEVRLFIRLGSKWLCKGSHTGQMNIVNKNVGDAYKGAVTDALQKCFSLLSVGCDAYRGLLAGVYKGNQQAHSLKTFPESVVAGQPQLQNVHHPQLTHNPPPKQVKHAQQQEPPVAPHEPQQQSSNLKKRVNQQHPQTYHQQPSYQEQPPKPSASFTKDGLPSDLPQIAGVGFDRVGDRIVANGDSYNKKALLKASGFRWDGTEKNWYKEIAA